MLCSRGDYLYTKRGCSCHNCKLCEVGDGGEKAFECIELPNGIQIDIDSRLQPWRLRRGISREEANHEPITMSSKAS